MNVDNMTYDEMLNYAVVKASTPLERRLLALLEEIDGLLEYEKDKVKEAEDRADDLQALLEEIDGLLEYEKDKVKEAEDRADDLQAKLDALTL